MRRMIFTVILQITTAVADGALKRHFINNDPPLFLGKDKCVVVSLYRHLTHGGRCNNLKMELLAIYSETPSAISTLFPLKATPYL